MLELLFSDLPEDSDPSIDSFLYHQEHYLLHTERYLMQIKIDSNKYHYNKNSEIAKTLTNARRWFPLFKQSSGYPRFDEEGVLALLLNRTRICIVNDEQQILCF